MMNDIVAYSGWLGHRNIGDEALYKATQKLFKSELSDSDYLSSYDNLVFGGGTVFPKYVMNHSGADIDGVKAAIGVGVRDPEFWNRRLSLIDIGYAIGKAGHGRILDNMYIHHLSKKAESVFSGVHMTDHYLPEDYFKEVKNFGLDYVGVRGPRSKSILSDFGINATVVGDTALSLEPTTYVNKQTEKIAIILREGGPKWNNDSDHKETILEFCKDHSSEYKFKFIPFYPGDIELHRDLASKVPNSSIADYCSHINVQAAIDELATSDLVISERLHGTVLAASTFTPFVSLEYRPKTRDFTESLSLGHYNIRVDELTGEKLREKANAVIHNQEFVDSLEGSVNAKRRSLQRFAAKIESNF